MSKICMCGVLVAVALVGASAGSATTIGFLGSNYNAVIGGNFSGDSGDTEGRHVTAGHFTVSTNFGYSIGTAVIGSQNPYVAGRDDLIVGGNFISGGTGSNASNRGRISSVGIVIGQSQSTDSVFGGTINPAPGTAVTGGSNQLINYDTNLTTGLGALALDRSTSNTVAAGSPNSVALSSLASALAADAASLRAVSGPAAASERFLGPSGGSVNFSNDGFGSVGIDISGPSGLYVVMVTSNFWSGTRYRTITAPAGAQVVLNVAGVQMQLLGTMTLAGGLDRSNVLANYYEATDVTLSQLDHQGSLLAGVATQVTQTGGGVNGAALVAGNYLKTGGGEFHNFTMSTSFASAIPEPSLAGFGASLVALGLALLRRRRQA